MTNTNITFCINTSKNELDHIKLLFKSLEINLSRRDYDILVFVDSDNQNTTGWLMQQKNTFKNLKIIKNPNPIPIGYQRNINLMFEMASTDVVSYLQSDMVVSKNYDFNILKNLDENTVISATRIEPPLHPSSSEKITHDLGLNPESFDFEQFQLLTERLKQNKITDYWFAPFTLYKKKWLEIGGHDTIFRRSREDSDILYRLCLNGMKFKQDWNCIVYHFTCTSSRGQNWWDSRNTNRSELQSSADKIEMMRFLHKWNKFKHNTTIDDEDFKYNISINFKNSKNHEQFIINNYFLFNKISVDDNNTYKKLKNDFESFHAPANILFDISDEMWKKVKNSFRTIEFESIFKNSPIENDNVIIDFDLNNLDEESIFNLKNMQHIIKNSISEGESGNFQLSNMYIKINSLENKIKDNITVKNPKFNMRLEYL